MQLSDIPEGSKIQIELKDGKKAFITFHHLDGLYSYCTLDGDEEKYINLSFKTPLKKVKDYYIIV